MERYTQIRCYQIARGSRVRDGYGDFGLNFVDDLNRTETSHHSP